MAPTLMIPPDLEKEITIIDLPLPDREDIRELLNETLAFAERNPKLTVSLTEEDRNDVVDAALGLTLSEARRVFSKALIDNYVFDANDVNLILFEKKAAY